MAVSRVYRRCWWRLDAVSAALLKLTVFLNTRIWNSWDASIVEWNSSRCINHQQCIVCRLFSEHVEADAQYWLILANCCVDVTGYSWFSMQELNGIMHQTCDGALSSDGALLQAQCLSVYILWLVSMFSIFECGSVFNIRIWYSAGFFDIGQIHIFQREPDPHFPTGTTSAFGILPTNLDPHFQVNTTSVFSTEGHMLVLRQGPDKHPPPNCQALQPWHWRIGLPILVLAALRRRR